MDNKKSYNKRLEALRSERSSHLQTWRELSDWILAHRGRFLAEKSTKIGRKRNTKQINSTGQLASRTLAAGMMTGLTNPARPWFSLTTPDSDLMDYSPVRVWLHEVEMKMRAIFQSSNIYNVLPGMYAELGTFGVGSLGIYEDFNNVIRAQQYTAGSFMLGINGKSEVDTQYREYTITVGQAVKQFGIENVSTKVKNLWDKGQTEAPVEVVHVYEPNDDRDMMSPKAKHKAIRSIYYEKGNTQGFLRESGFDSKAILTPRWEVVGESVYSDSCPGMIAIGDVKALQIQEKRKATAVDKMVDPPLQFPAYLQNQVGSGFLHPGEHIFVPNTAQGARSVYDVNPDISALRDDMHSIETRINKAYFVDLFLMLANSNRSQITAREIEERHEEKLLMLSPVLERLFYELLDPMIERTFDIANRAGVFPEPPPELDETNLRIEYVSTLAQAMKRTNLAGIDQTAAFVTNLAQVFPEARHKFNAEQAVDEYAQSVGISPKIIRSDEEVQAIKDAEQKQIMQQQAMEGMAQAAQAAKTASEINPDSAVGEAII